MAAYDLSDNTKFYEADDSNTVYFPEGMNAAVVDDGVRSVIGAVKRWWNRSNATLTSTGSSNAYVLTYGTAPYAYGQGESYSFFPSFSNTGATTLNVNSLGAIQLLRPDGSATQSGDIVTGRVAQVIYTASPTPRFLLLNPVVSSLAPSGTASGDLGGTYPSPTVVATHLSSPLPIAQGGTGSTVTSCFIPIGGILMWATTSPPTGYFMCTGQTISRTTYATLFGVIGTTYGAGDGSTTFAVPDYRGRVLAGYDAGNATSRLTTSATGGASASAITNTGGEQAHTLTTAELAVHSHGITDPGHYHTITYNYSLQSGSSTNCWTTGFGGTSQWNTDANVTGITANNTGSGSAHNTVQPTAIVNYCIRAL